MTVSVLCQENQYLAPQDLWKGTRKLSLAPIPLLPLAKENAS